jgi:hypothetical protein
VPGRRLVVPVMGAGEPAGLGQRGRHDLESPGTIWLVPGGTASQRGSSVILRAAIP